MLFQQPLRHARTVLHVDTKFPCSFPQDQQSAPCFGMLLRVSIYLIYEDLSPILPAIHGAEPIFLPAIPRRQGNPGTRAGTDRRGRVYSMTMRGGGRRSEVAPLTFSQIRAAIRRKTTECGLSGSATVIGVPLSEVSRILRSSGTSPRNSTPSRSASRRAPPCEKISRRPPQCGHRK